MSTLDVKNIEGKYYISVEDAKEIVGDYSNTATCVYTEEGDRHRWYRDLFTVFKTDSTHFGVYWMDPASELQEDQDLFHSDPVEIYPVESYEQIITKWRKI